MNVRISRLAFALVTSVCVQAVAGGETSSEKYLQLRTQANHLYEMNNFVDALPLYKQLVAEEPDDVLLRERYGMILASVAQNAATVEERRATRAKALEQVVRAKELGDKSDLNEYLVITLSNDSSETPFSQNETVDKLMRSAEGAFSRGDLVAARTGYLMALQADPSLYEAALFIGDTFYKEGKLEKAGEWFSKAIDIDPNRETAYRYWGDSLLAEKKMAEARQQFVNAIIAEPYSQLSRTGLTKWVTINKQSFSVPQIKPLATVSVDQADKISINVSADSMEASAEELGGWVVYASIRSQWREETFAKTYPNESKYRHTLAEETMAYKGAVTLLTENGGKEHTGKNKSSQLSILSDLINQDLLESYILLFQPDKEIIQDYEPYRETHRDNLVRMLEYVIKPTHQ